MHSLATAHADERAPRFITAMQEFSALPPENRPLVSPYGVVLAEMVALVGLLRASAAEHKELAIGIKDPKTSEAFNQIVKQIDLAALAIRSIDLF